MPAIRFAIASVMLAACGGVDKINNLPDAPETPDTPVCMPQSDTALCQAIEATCGTQTATDNCGEQRTVDCGVCPPVCSNLNFTQTALTAAVNSAPDQDAIMGVSDDGKTLLNQRRSVCGGPFQLLLVDGFDGTPLERDITNLPPFDAMDTTRENAISLTADGLSVIAVNKSGTGMLLSTRSAIGALDFSTALPGPFAAITATAPGILNNPVLSSDGLALYYRQLNPDIIFESVRTSKTAPFPPATPLADDIQQADVVTGISSDRLALFLQGNFGMVVFTRAKVTDAFTNPNAPNPPPSLPGFRVRPLGDCQTLVGTCTGGCTGEETCRITH